MSETITSFEAFRACAAERRVAHVAQTLYFDTETPVSIYLKLRESSDHSFLLESVEGGRTLGRYSIVGIDPIAVVSIREGVPSAAALKPSGEPFVRMCAEHQEPLALLRALVESVSSVGLPDQPRFTGGWVGYFGYDSVRFIESIPMPPQASDDPPEVMLALFMDVVVIDNVSRTITLLSNEMIEAIRHDDDRLRKAHQDACERVRKMRELLESPAKDTARPAGTGDLIDAGTDRPRFTEWVKAGKEYITAGDIFQVVLSRRQTIRLSTDPLQVYRALRRINPSPYMYFLTLGSLQVVGSSPEMLVRVEHGHVQTRPIAGTRPRGKDEESDLAIGDELRKDAKEKAEHLMLVDLARNDLGKICIPGSVRVPDFMSIERYSHVMHLCSTVSGELKEGSSPIDALYACFPAGTLSGAPKVRAMQIISEMETVRRGVYGGAIGYIDFSGNLDTCIAIRTIVARDGMFKVQAGAGIVHDSVPEKEFDETVDKMGALLEALKASGYSEGQS